ncbi:hypothetical protein KEM54_005984 [Ascosphaera aggregata]|nr:hypothetical protein KEM54_005984 [Ascosphaera aggregata]
MPSQSSANSAIGAFETLLFVRFLATLDDARPENIAKSADALRRDEHVQAHRQARLHDETVNEAFDSKANDENLSNKAFEKLYLDLLQEMEQSSSSALKPEEQKHDATQSQSRRASTEGASRSTDVSACANFQETINSIVARLYTRYRKRAIREILEDEEKYRSLTAEIKELEEQEEAEQLKEQQMGQKHKPGEPTVPQNTEGINQAQKPMTPLQAQLAQAKSLAASLGTQYPSPAQKQGTAISAAPTLPSPAQQQLPQEQRPPVRPTSGEPPSAPHVPVSVSQASTGQLLTPITAATTTSAVSPVLPLTTAPSQPQSPASSGPSVTTEVSIRARAPSATVAQAPPLRPPPTQPQPTTSPTTETPVKATPAAAPPPPYQIPTPQPRKTVSRQPTPPQTHILQQALRESNIPQSWTVSTPATTYTAVKAQSITKPTSVVQSQPLPQPQLPASQPSPAQQPVPSRPPPTPGHHVPVIPRPAFIPHQPPQPPQKPAQYKFQPPYAPSQPPPHAVSSNATPHPAAAPSLAGTPSVPPSITPSQQQQLQQSHAVPLQPLQSQSPSAPTTESPAFLTGRVGSQTPSFLETFKRRPSRLSIHSSGTRTPWKAPSPINTAVIGSPVRPRPEDVSPITKETAEPLFAKLNDALEAAAAASAAETSPSKTTARGEKKKVDVVEEEEKDETAASPGTAKKAGRKPKAETKSLPTSPVHISARTRSGDASVLSADDEETGTDTGLVSHHKTRRVAAGNGRRSPSTATVTEESEVERRTSARLRASRQLSEEIKPEKGVSPAKTKPLKRKRESLDEDEHIGSPQFVQCTRNFTRTSGTIMNDVAAHKCASIFAKPITERDAPGYHDLIYRPQDIKSIKSAIHQGSKAVAAALEASEEESTAGNGLLLERSADLIPPKSIINSAQLEMELIRMFANAIMFNPTPETTFGPAFPMRREILNAKGNKGFTESTAAMESEEPFQEGGIITDTLDMFEDVETAVKRWRAAESAVAGDDAIVMVGGGGSGSSGYLSSSATVSKLRRASVADPSSAGGDNVDDNSVPHIITTSKIPMTARNGNAYRGQITVSTSGGKQGDYRDRQNAAAVVSNGRGHNAFQR